jgi:hypothetical protein
MIGDRSLHLCRFIDRCCTFTIPVIADVKVIPFGSSSTTLTLTDLIKSLIFCNYTELFSWEHFFSFL